jgi:hypothetical protein
MTTLEVEVGRQLEACRARLAELRGEHVAVQALWDGA